MHLLLNTLPTGDSAITAAERQDVACCYAGILAGSLAAFPRRTMNMMMLLNTLPPGDSVIDQADRQDVAWLYGGILAGAPAGVPTNFIPEEFLDKSIL